MLTILDIRFIQLHLSKMTDEEIAEMLGKPVEMVSSRIKEETDRDSTRQSRSQFLAAKARKKENERNGKVEQERLAKLNTRLAEQARKAAKRNQNFRPAKSVETAFKTRTVNLQNKIAVRIDRKTLVFVDPNADIERIRLRYKKG